jgi:hypothetical protein
LYWSFSDKQELVDSTLRIGKKVGKRGVSLEVGVWCIHSKIVIDRCIYRRRVCFKLAPSMVVNERTQGVKDTLLRVW